MGKNEKTMLGRSLVKHMNQVAQQNKEKGRTYNKQNKKVLESVTEVTDIEAVLEQAEESERLFSSENPIANVFNMDKGSNSKLTAEDRKREEALHASSLRVPRRPAWHAKMSADELDANERQSFLVWRRNLASLEENENLVLTPFEKNLDIWRQLWRVLERSDLLVMVVDARDPLFYRCPDLEDYAMEIDEHKKTLLLINKADLLPQSIREKWAQYFNDSDILFLFWSAKAATATLEGKQLKNSWHRQNVQLNKNDETKIYGRDELLARLQFEAENIVKLRTNSTKEDPSYEHGTSGGVKHVVVGFVGYPNVGKSSTINALVGEKRTGVTSTPGKTKHFQTLIISDELMLCDCPGLVFPSFSSSRYEMIASGVLPIHRMTEHREAVQVVANRVPRHVVEEIYNIKLPKPKPYEPQSRPPLAAELLRAYCASRGWVASSGLPDETRAARQILEDYIDGKLPHFELPPGLAVQEIAAGHNAGVDDDASQSSEEEEEDDPDDEDSASTEPAGQPDLEHVLDDLTSFDVANGLAPKKAAVKKPSAAHKHHKKPQRSKNRSWRVATDGTDGTPIVRVFQKPVNTGPLRVT
uniref:CP-type G domain-containing protein n=1 Tax=Kalanchoe fedtschenkoi TaxID=63787 RepID=A0A7N1A4J1_KALFE